MGGVFDGLGGLRGGFCRYGVPVETCLGDLWGLLWIHGYFFGHLGGSWCDFGWPWGPFGVLLGAFGSHLGAFGWPVAAFLVFCVGKRETVKSVVLLKENLCFEGWRGSWLELFFIFFAVWRCL